MLDAAWWKGSPHSLLVRLQTGVIIVEIKIQKLKIHLPCVLVTVSTAVKRYHDMVSYKGKHLIEVVAYSFTGLVHYHHGGEHGG